MALLRSLAFYLVFYGGTVFFVAAALIGAAVGERPMQRVIRAWSRFHGWCVRRLLGIELRIEGEMPEGPLLFAAKHEAMYETLELISLLDAPAIVLKQELTRIPAWGWLARQYGGIAVDRAGGASAMREMLRAARAALSQGRAIVIFPEGTRVPPGTSPPLRAGFAGLYRMLNVPVVAIALDSGRLWPRDGWIKRAGVITMRFSAPIPSKLARDEIEARIHKEINALGALPDHLA
ncbi:MAG: 1-acyl-sn-glycerol-3-phosphate acyltransferase [Sphingomonadaceae bacterium]|nr:1-acyl-sn-glycerol-3-phosphate acyltransferase [Sphingomonadaceae bacterium]